MARARGGTTADVSPIFTAPPHAPVQCPRCGRLYEEPFEVEGIRLRGHVQGGPDCHKPGGPLSGEERDARTRRVTRRGR